MPKKKSASTERRTRPPPPTIRRTSQSRSEPEPAPERPPDAEQSDKGTWRQNVSQRFQNMGASHLLTGVAAGTVGNVVGVSMVGLGWVRPKTTAVAMMGTGAAATTAGYVWEADHIMAAGLGLSTAGTFSLVNQYTVEAYEAVEKRAKEKKLAKENQERKLEGGQKSQKKAQRNAAPHLTVVASAEDDDDDDDDYFDEDDYDVA